MLLALHSVNVDDKYHRDNSGELATDK